MGKRSTGKAESRAVGAFARQRMWRATELAQTSAVDPQDLASCLEHLRKWGLPLSQCAVGDEVQYSVSHSWFELWRHPLSAPAVAAARSDADGVLGTTLDRDSNPHAAPQLDAYDVDAVAVDSQAGSAISELEFMVEALLRMPRGRMREQLLRRVLEGQFLTNRTDVAELCVGLSKAANRSLQELLLKAASSRSVVRARVFDGRGRLTIARLTVHRVVPNPNGIVASDHALRQLKWYPYGSIISASLLRGEKGKRADPEELEAFMDDLLIHDSNRVALEHAFTVRYPEADWVASHLPPGMSVDENASNDGGLRVIVRDNGPLAARLVASLGGAAIAEGPVLTGLVSGIAAGTLAAHRHVVEADVSLSTRGIHSGDSSPSHDEGPPRSTFRPRSGEAATATGSNGTLDEAVQMRGRGLRVKPGS